jgi:hypothetical protein
LKNTYLFNDYLLDSVGLNLDMYGDALQGDPIGHVWKLVADCQASGQRHSALYAVIMNDNEMNHG